MITKYKIFKENLNNIKIDILDNKRFITEIVNNDNYKYQYKFLLKADGGKKAFKYYMYDDYRKDDVYFFILFLNDEPVAMSHIEKSPYIDNTYWLSYLCVDPNFEGNGYASILADKMFEWFKENNLQFETSRYTEIGFVKLKPLFNKLAQKYNVPFIDKNKF